MTTSMQGDNQTIALGPVNYGKSEVRLLKVTRGPDRDMIHDLNVAVTLHGDFTASYVGGDNRAMVATDTMRNTVYAFAKQHPLDAIESFGLALVDRFLQTGPTVAAVTVEITEYPWQRIAVEGQEHPHAFLAGAGERTARITGSADGRQVVAGVANLRILKTTDSGWVDFHHDEYTTLPDASDRILATMLTATWSYGRQTELPFNELWQTVHERILTTFTDHYSPSVQNTLYRMGKAVLEACPPIEQIHFSLPNIHHLVFDLGRFGMDNHNEIFHVTSAPYGLIEGTVERRKA